MTDSCSFCIDFINNELIKNRPSMMNEQENFWKHEYAKDYISKNSDFNLKKGVAGWKEMLKKANDINTILECGCNIGRNINFLNHLLPVAEKSAIEINPDAFKIATTNYKIKNAYNGSIVSSNLIKNSFDLAFTCGVLIHIPPDELLQNMKKLFDYSKKYILIGEYFNRTPVMLEYQGQQNKLFKRDFGKLFIENFDVELVDYGFLWGHIYDEAGFDDITYWLFKKK